MAALSISLIFATTSSAASLIFEMESTPKQLYNYVPKNVTYTDSVYTLEYSYKVSGIKGSGSN